MSTPKSQYCNVKMPQMVPTRHPVACGDTSPDISSGSDSSPDLSPADECIEPDTFDLSRCSVNLNLDLTELRSPITNDLKIRRSTQSDLSSCDLSPSASYLYDDLKQELHDLILDAQHNETEVITYDSFLAKLHDSDSSSQNSSFTPQSTSQIRQFETTTESEKLIKKPSQDLKYFKEQALVRQKQHELKSLAATKIQAWFRARRVRRVYKPIL